MCAPWWQLLAGQATGREMEWGKNPVSSQGRSPPFVPPSQGLEALESGQSPFNIPELRYK